MGRLKVYRNGAWVPASRGGGLPTEQHEMGYAETGNTESTDQPASRSFLAVPIAATPDVPLFVTLNTFVQSATGAEYVVALWVGNVQVARSLPLQGGGLNSITLTRRIPPSSVARDVHVRYGPTAAGSQVSLIANGPENYFNTLRVTR